MALRAAGAAVGEGLASLLSTLREREELVARAVREAVDARRAWLREGAELRRRAAREGTDRPTLPPRARDGRARWQRELVRRREASEANVRWLWRCAVTWVETGGAPGAPRVGERGRVSREAARAVRRRRAAAGRLE